MKKLLISLAAVTAMATMSAPSFAQTKWDLPSGYGANTFQVQNLTQFATDVDKATAGSQCGWQFCQLNRDGLRTYCGGDK